MPATLQKGPVLIQYQATVQNSKKTPGFQKINSNLALATFQKLQIGP
jgi:hypothetical protein